MCVEKKSLVVKTVVFLASIDVTRDPTILNLQNPTIQGTSQTLCGQFRNVSVHFLQCFRNLSFFLLN